MPAEPQEWTPEDVETLARFMGWPRIGGPSTSDLWWDATSQHAWHGEATKHLRESRGVRDHPYLFTPFTDARHDLQVLERVREVWRGEDPRWLEFRVGLPRAVDYTAGAFSRAALEVLREMEVQTDG